jgi:hypothetical protein
MAALKDTLPHILSMHVLLPAFGFFGFTCMKYVAHGKYYIIKIGYGTTTKPIQNKKRRWDIQ